MKSSKQEEIEMKRTLRNLIMSVFGRYKLLTRDMWKKIKHQEGDLKGLRKASSSMMGMFIKEIDVLTPEKLRAVRRVRSLLGKRHGGE